SNLAVTTAAAKSPKLCATAAVHVYRAAAPSSSSRRRHTAPLCTQSSSPIIVTLINLYQTT
ncbi:hypothetical protein A2U01_0103932, partial [Trifolium medium]|nr:hypothetical protein [Trifolium medium]